ncbi:MAG: TraR/DksA C4-type zinc finger protein [Deltaproteobacteria bacterium]|jgi:DnaK suppressor protein|nr:TraR/DksA C4-type zinc finger protein [Deltaproteobacteria bacterium]
MNKKTVEHLKNRLIRELEDLQQGENCNLNGLSGSDESLPDLVDRASSFIDRSLSQSMCDRQNLRIKKIEEALEDIENGEYGICRHCGEDIAMKRLKANPIARHCITCKSAMENRGRLVES